MMESSQQSSSSENLDAAFASLHPEIKRWIYDQQWTELRAFQARAISAVSLTDRDVILAAATASGKTEAAFFPILSSIVAEPIADSFQVMYVGPLRALINDQFLRLELLCERLHVPVTKWHGDVQDSMKRRAREKPAGVLLITPESLEALFVRRPEVLTRMFRSLGFVVVDELHSFLSTERGLQLASLLKRLESRVSISPRRIGLSATIGDLSLAAKWLRPNDPSSVAIIEDSSNAADLRLQIRGVKQPERMSVSETETPSKKERARDVSLRQISTHLFQTLRSNGNHLIFASSRREVELLADLLRESSESAGVSNEFFPHHGNLSREMREVLEHRLKAGSELTTAVATSTLELGVDIGSVESVAQIGAPRSIAALKQRMGRSGRRKGKPSILRIYATEAVLNEKSSILDCLRLETVQSVAAIRLMLDKWIEPPITMSQNLSTLLHQILSLVVEYGGISYGKLLEIVGGPGPFGEVPVATIRELLKGMALTDPPLLEQAPDGTLMLGEMGETITGSYEFFAVFKTIEEFRIVANGRTLGTVSIVNSFGPDDYIVFAGQRWKVITVDDRSHTVHVESAPAGKAPMFEGGEPAGLHDEFVAKMRSTLANFEVPIYLDPIASQHLLEAKDAFMKAQMDKKQVIKADGLIYLFPWRGTTTLDALRLALKKSGIVADQSSISLSVKSERLKDLLDSLTSLSHAPTVDGIELAKLDHNLERSKFDHLIPRRLLQQSAAKDRLNSAAIPDLARSLCSEINSTFL